MKVISEMLGHKSTKITADTCTTVLLEVAREAAEATARLVPRRHDDGVTTPCASGSENKIGRSSRRNNAYVRPGAPPGTRTPNPGIKSRLLLCLDVSLYAAPY
jgi:hypothetical protein